MNNGLSGGVPVYNFASFTDADNACRAFYADDRACDGLADGNQVIGSGSVIGDYRYALFQWDTGMCPYQATATEVTAGEAAYVGQCYDWGSQTLNVEPADFVTITASLLFAWGSGYVAGATVRIIKQVAEAAS